MLNYKDLLRKAKGDSVDSFNVAGHIYLSCPTFIFKENENIDFEIRDRISKLYSIPVRSVRVIGSAKTGFSLIKNTDFEKGRSDLDIAIVDEGIFIKIWEDAYHSSNGFSRDKLGASDNADRFLNNLSRGFINPDLLPSGGYRAKIIRDFKAIGNSYKSFFGKITVFFYANEFFFKVKQKEAIEMHWRYP